ncbi:uncharacterized protein A4U43_C08F13320 [Asparagus officinalis]|nr:uncharacterized protein A4U43_C08F13320 [Asparagus officinalis]
MEFIDDVLDKAILVVEKMIRDFIEDVNINPHTQENTTSSECADKGSKSRITVRGIALKPKRLIAQRRLKCALRRIRKKRFQKNTTTNASICSHLLNRKRDSATQHKSNKVPEYSEEAIACGSFFEATDHVIAMEANILTVNKFKPHVKHNVNPQRLDKGV